MSQPPLPSTCGVRSCCGDVKLTQVNGYSQLGETTKQPRPVTLNKNEQKYPSKLGEIRERLAKGSRMRRERRNAQICPLVHRFDLESPNVKDVQ